MSGSNLRALFDGPTDRRSLAATIRVIRKNAAHVNQELVEWVYHVLSDRPAVLRLYIDVLLLRGDVETAEGLLATALLTRPSDPLLAMRRARVLLAKGRLADADRELSAAARSLNRHAEIPLLGARLKRLRGESDEAMAMLRLAARRPPRMKRVQCELAAALIEGGDAALARRLMADAGLEDAGLVGKLLAVEGRVLDAREHLDRAIEATPDPRERDELAAHLITLVRTHGSLDQVARVLERVPADGPRVLAAMGEAMLSIGAFATAVRRMEAALSVPEAGGSARYVLVVAASFAGEPGLARLALRQIEQSRGGMDRRRMARLWRLGLLGQALQRGQRSATETGADPSCRLLPRMIDEARHTLEAAARNHPLSASERADLTRQVNICRRFSDARVLPPL